MITRNRFSERLRACERQLRNVPSPYLRTQARDLREAMPNAWYRRLPLIDGEPRVARLTGQLVLRTQADFDLDAILDFFKDQPFTLAELWAIGPMLRLALLETAVAGNLHAEGTLRRLESASWRDLVEALSVVDRILRQDPVYGHMDFETRDAYRHGVERLAQRRRLSEEEAARTVLEESRRSGRELGSLLIGHTPLDPLF